MTKGRPLKLLLVFTLPALLSNFLSQVYSLTDSIIVGKVLGNRALDAIGVTMPIILLIVSLVIGVNIGCGTVTVNYDGITKNRCVIGDNSFVGCNTNLIAPVKLGKAVYTAAGTTVTRDIPDYALAIERGVMKINEGYTIRKLKTKQGK